MSHKSFRKSDIWCFSGMRQQSGLSLIELMIAMVLGLIIVAALTSLFVDVSQTNREMAKTNSQIENARFAMQFLEEDIVHAGYWGGFVPQFDDLTFPDIPGDVPLSVPDPCLPFSTPWDDWADFAYSDYVEAMIGMPVAAYESLGTCAVVADQVAGTDILVVRHAETCVPGVDPNCDADQAGRLYFQASNCAEELDAVPPQYFAMDPNSYPLCERDCLGIQNCPSPGATPAAKRRFIQNIYYVRDYAVDPSDGIPTLVRSEFDLSGGALSQRPAQALVEGIERFRVELGIDNISETGVDIIDESSTCDGNPCHWKTAINWDDPDNRITPRNRGDGVPDGNFVHCTDAAPCTAAQLANTVSVKLYLLARANEASPGYTDTKSYTMGGLNVPAFNDGFKRHVFSTSVRLQNVAGRRETP